VAGVTAAGSPPAQARVTSPVIVRLAAVSWGDDSGNQLGRTTGNWSLYSEVAGLDSDVVQVAAGVDHGLAVMSDGTVWAWGTNDFGQLGDGTQTDRSTPVRVMGLTGVIQVAAGAAFSLALLSDGKVWAWGANGVGQLGNGGTSAHQLTPAKVKRLTRVTKIVAGRGYDFHPGGHSLALRSDGTVWAWGLNHNGQLGTGTTVNSSLPVQVPGLSHVTGISAGNYFCLATRTSGISPVTSVWAWGANDRGQLGDGTLASHLTPEQVTGISAPFIASIAAGGSSALVLGTDGRIWAWGDNRSGQLGTAPSSSPVTRPVITAGSGSGITQLAAGYDHVLALKSDRTVLASGGNGSGQLGDGNDLPVVGRVQVTSLANVRQVAAGQVFSLAVRAA
jgi:alpha-tubulin suppressor-like RCC1 family protein